MPAKLTLYPLRRVPRFLVLRDQENIEIGRDPMCGLSLEDPRVSRHHARLLWTGGDWALEDLDSKNGTTLNGRELRELRVLEDGDWISFGGLPARFERLSAAQAAGLDSDRLARIHTSADMQRRLSEALEPLDLLGRFVELAIHVARAERGFLLTVGKGGTLKPEIIVGFSPGDLGTDRFRGSVGAVKEVLDSGDPMIVSDVLADPRLGHRQNVITQGIWSLACLPLRSNMRNGAITGVIYVDRLRPGASLTALDVETLETLATHTASLLSSCLQKKAVPPTGDEPLSQRLLLRLEELLPTA